MSDYQAPVEDTRFLLKNVIGMGDIAKLPGYEEATEDLVDAVLEEAAKFSQEQIAPLNQVGDQEGARLENGVVRTAPGFKEAYHKFVEGGWNGLPFEPEWGGQGLPWALNSAVTEMWDAACTAWSLCPMLTVGAIEAIQAHGTDEMKQTYLPKLVSGEWTGTMNLTEPQAGSDVGALKTKAWKDGDHWRIKGQKIYITYGDQDYTDNIVHLVLARTEGAPEGVKGISLFLVPKVMVNEDGSLGPRNDVRTLSLEHKLGIHASPTCVMGYGEDEGAVGYLIGKEYEGLACMFTMMNNARLNVGQLGLGTGDRAYQQARDFAMERVQGRDIESGEQGVTIVHHPDVRRMLMLMKAQTEAMRAMCLFTSSQLDFSKHHPEDSERKKAKRLLDLMTPITKAWCTDVGCEVAHTGVQVHGGMGFIEETGAAQHMRDARIHPIYEGTNGIQANDLVGRKVLREGGETAKEFMARMGETLNDLAGVNDPDVAALQKRLASSLDSLEQATDWILATGAKDIAEASAAAVPYLTLWGNVVGGWLMAQSAMAAAKGLAGANGDGSFLEAKIKTARFYGDQILTRSGGLLDTVTDGAGTVMALAEEQF